VGDRVNLNLMFIRQFHCVYGMSHYNRGLSSGCMLMVLGGPFPTLQATKRATAHWRRSLNKLTIVNYRRLIVEELLK